METTDPTRLVMPPNDPQSPKLPSLIPPSILPEEREDFERWRLVYHQHMGHLVQEGLSRRAKSGMHPGRAPLGYRNVGKGIETDPDTAPLVREAFERAAVPGASLRAVLREMTAKGLRSRNGKPLSVSALWYVLTNPFNRGVVCWHGQLMPGTHKPLISEAEFFKVRARISEASNQRMK